MQITRTSALVALMAAGALTLSACGSNNNSTATSSTSSSSAAASAVPSSSSSAPASAMASSAPASAMASSAPASAMASGSTSASAPTFAGSGFTCATGTLRSSGSTAQGTAIGQWIKDYNAKCGATINAYGGGGSGKGVSDFTSNQTDFGGSDSALKDTQFPAANKRCGGNDAINLPMVTGPIAVAYNVPGVTKLTMTPQVLAGIFGGKITNWNDPAIAALNKGVTLPSLAIATIHRSEASGTTDNFTKYLTAAGGWTFPGGKSWTAPGGTGAQGSDGAAKAVSTTSGAIGYVEWSFAQSLQLSMAAIDNGGGPVTLTGESAGKAVQAAKVVGKGKDLSLQLDYATKTPGAYPVILVTYEIVCSAGNGSKAALLKSFMGYTATDGQTALVKIGSAPLPVAIQDKVIAAAKAIS